MKKEEIKKIIPYDEPFLFVDEVKEITDTKISGYKQTNPEDYYFQGHFVNFPIMPGVLIAEGLAQLSTIILRQKIGENHKNFHFLAYNIKSCHFYKPVFPGDRIDLEAEILGIYPLGKNGNKIARVKAQAQVKQDVKCEIRFSVAIIKKEGFENKYKK